MRAIVKEKDGVFIRDIPVPPIGPKEVLIRVAYVAYCRTDGYVARDQIKTKTPLVLGHEFSGVIERVGDDVSKFKKDDRVAVMPILPDAEGKYLGPMFGVDIDGAFADYVAVPEIAVYHIPDTVKFMEAAYLEPIAASSAILKIDFEREKMGFILGDNRIANLTKRILDFYNYNSPDIISVDKAKTLTDNSYDFAIETIATTETMSLLTRVVKPGGTIILKSRQFQPVEINVKKIVEKELKFIGLQYGDFQKGIELLAGGLLKVNDMFEVRDLPDALGVLTGEWEKFEDKKFFFNTHLCAE